VAPGTALGPNETMTEKILISDFAGESSDFGDAMLHALACAAHPNPDLTEVFKIEPGCVSVEVEFRVNGVDVSLKSIIDGLFSEFNDKVSAKATELVNDRLRERLGRLEQSLEDTCRAFANELKGTPNE
jgi:hypothetical protein